ncbi:type III secretion system chaperone [Shewanella surugensis]|uniref:Type III secretion system chaperone n=1 Tax=Shewanella surugensis TaxID=212020 RepID=A0ABT0LEU0_9GAMM|nr:type III secretion system chaperone [Shewanella surugensis]MCL1126069.1 type III secretion system chaperone [Shewanella surugensis]
MYDVKQIDLMFSELGELIDADSIIKFDDQHWKITFGEGKEVDITHTPESHKLTLESYVGRVESTDRQALYLLLLEYNYCWRDTGGIRMAMHEDHLVQLYDLFTQELSLDGLVGILTRFSERLTIWNNMLKGG